MLAHDPHALLETAARILAQNETHTVIAWRLPNEVLAEIAPFLAALMEAALARGKREKVD